MRRHGRDNYFVVGEGIYTIDDNDNPVFQRPSTLAELRKFRFSRLGPMGDPIDDAARQIFEGVAEAMSGGTGDNPDSDVPAGFTYLGQFVDHDLTKDVTDVHLGQDVTVDELLQGRSPALDLDSLYGRGPDKDPQFYADHVRLKTGTTVGVGFPQGNTVANHDQDGFDLPRVGAGSTKQARRTANIPDTRNDENLAVAQTHLMFIRFHNTVVNKLSGTTPSVLLFPTVRREVVKHYQWTLRTDYLPRIVDPAIVDDVYTNGRKFFEIAQEYSEDALYSVLGGDDPHVLPGDTPTMPVEFSIAAFRLGHSMVRETYEWNAVFNTKAGRPAGLHLLFQFSGTSGILSPGNLNIDDPEAGNLERLPSNWIADFRRLYDFSEANQPGLVVAKEDFNVAEKLDTLLVNPLHNLPLGTFGGRGTVPVPTGRALNLAFRNLTRAGMVRLASGQQMAQKFGITPLTPDQVIKGAGEGASFDAAPGQLDDSQKAFLGEHTPLWFYVLREAELNNGRLTGVGGRIVAEVFHRAMEGSSYSIVRDPAWRPSFGPDSETFRMVDLCLFAVDGDASKLFPLG
jgi:hypothetical protein